MSQCEDTIRRLWEFLDGELEPVSMRVLQRHLEVCARCYPRHDFQRAYFKVMHQIRDQNPIPRELRIRLFERIMEEEATIGQNEPMGRLA